MWLSKADIERLERAGHRREDFVRYDEQGFAQLRNRDGYCVFYDPALRLCRAYRDRPQGCRIYPVVYSEDEGVMVHDLCPMKETVSSREMKQKGRLLLELLQRIFKEARLNHNSF
jgi:Fe-S-cluster containining protein